MTLYESENGMPLGATFAGDKGITYHMTTEECENLMSLDHNVRVIRTNSMGANTVGELIEIYMSSTACTAEEYYRRFGNKPLRPKTQMFINPQGELLELIVKH